MLTLLGVHDVLVLVRTVLTFFLVSVGDAFREATISSAILHSFSWFFSAASLLQTSSQN